MLVHDATKDRRLGRSVMDLETHRIAFATLRAERLLHRADSVAALAKLAKGRLHTLAQFPNPGRVFGRQPHLLQLAKPAQAQRPLELPPRFCRVMAQVEETGIGFLDHGAVDPGETV